MGTFIKTFQWVWDMAKHVPFFCNSPLFKCNMLDLQKLGNSALPEYFKYKQAYLIEFPN